MKKITPPKTEPIVEEIWSDERLDALHQVNMADSAITASARIILKKSLKKVDK